VASIGKWLYIIIIYLIAIAQAVVTQFPEHDWKTLSIALFVLSSLVCRTQNDILG
jgi:predicted membrane channel-forming protein YqfA (hemolysin III family)